jgi:group I intron endonuclease
MRSGIYVIRNLVNGKRYIGSSVDIFARWRQHRHALKRGTHHSSHLQNAWRKYGSEAFRFEVLFYCRKPQLEEQEGVLLRAQPSPEYNFGHDASAPWRDKRHTPETCAKLGEISRRRQSLYSPERKAEISKNQSLASLGKPKNREHAANIGRGHWRSVDAVHIVTGEVRQYRSLTASVSDGFSVAHISACCKGKRSSHRGWRWKYSDSDIFGEYRPRGTHNPRRKPFQDQHGRVYQTQAEAASIVGVDRSSISDVLMGERSEVKGFRFSYIGVNP